jgi:hypothetical protein
MKKLPLLTPLLIGAMLVFSALIIVPLSGCKDDPAAPDSTNEQELITDVTYQLAEEGGTDTTTATFHDPDGEGGTAPTITGLTLKAGKVYHGSLELYDRSGATPDTITHEVEEESDSHRFDFTLSGDAAGRISITILDMDANSLPVGLDTRVGVSAGVAATGTLKVKLNHFGTVTKGLANSDETDIEIDFPVTIE